LTYTFSPRLCVTRSALPLHYLSYILALRSSPTRRSSDLALLSVTLVPALMGWFVKGKIRAEAENPLNRWAIQVYRPLLQWAIDLDRKSTRLNSSHGSISYAVFCLKKKTEQADRDDVVHDR